MKATAGQTIVFRADGGREIGMGHIMRCIGLAQAFRKRGYHTFFISGTHSDSVASRLEYEDFDCSFFETGIDSASDLSQFISECRQRQADWVVVDGYRFGSEWLKGLKNEGFKVLLWTDYLQADYLPVDIILDQTPADNAEAYKKVALPDTHVLSGLQYVVLRDEFLVYPDIRRVRSAVQNVLVTFGGADKPGGTVKVLQAIKDGCFQEDFDIVVGPANPWLDEIVNIVNSMCNAQVHIATKNMAGLIAKADLAISAAGASLWEFAFSGLPTIAMSIAENQKLLAESLEQLECGVNLGTIEQFSPVVFLEILSKLLDSSVDIENYSHRLLRLVDGEGRERVVSLVSSIDR